MKQPPGSPQLNGLDEYQRLLNLLDQRRFDEARARARLLVARPDSALLVRAKAHNLLCWISVEGLKEPGVEAVYHGLAAVRLARLAAATGLLLQALVNHASACLQAGRYPEARAAYLEVQQAVRNEPELLPGGPVLVLCGLAQVALVEGNPADALRLLTAAETLCEDTGHTGPLLPDTRRRKAIALLALGQPDLAAQTLADQEDQQYAGEPRSLWWKLHLRFTRARVELALGHWVTARSLATATLALARELGDAPVTAECLTLLAEVDQAENRKEAPQRARAALLAALATGRRDMVAEAHQRLSAMLLHGF